MLTVEEALERILVDVQVQPAEALPLEDALERVLAAQIRSPRDVPPWDNSAMDGYAVRAADTTEGAVSLVLNEIIGAGEVATVPVLPGTATGIMTGAPMPEGADAVVMIERTDGAQTGAVHIEGRVYAGDHIRPRGGDVARDSVVLTAGTTLTPARLGLVASLGLPTVSVRRRPVVAVLSTGDEVVAPGQPLGPGQIYSSNNIALRGLAAQAGATAIDHGNAPDDLDGLIASLRDCLSADVVITTGGVSMGVYDFVKEAYGALGAEMDFWKVRMKPGKPLAFGRVQHEGRTIPLFGLPGNPVSCLVNFHQFVRPYLRQMVGDPRPYLPVVDAVSESDFRDNPGRARLIRVTLRREGGQFLARSTGTQSSGVLKSMAHAHGLLCVGVEDEAPKRGEAVRVQLLDMGFLDGETPDYGW